MKYDDLILEDMKQYKPRTVLRATPMTLGEYAKRDGQTLTDEDDPFMNGFFTLQINKQGDHSYSWFKETYFDEQFEEIVK